MRSFDIVKREFVLTAQLRRMGWHSRSGICVLELYFSQAAYIRGGESLGGCSGDVDMSPRTEPERHPGARRRGFWPTLCSPLFILRDSGARTEMRYFPGCG